MTNKKITPTNIKKNNRKKIYEVIYEHLTIAKQEIATLTNISLPTIASNLEDFEKEGLISRKETFASTGGRKARMIVCVQDAKVAIGVEIAKTFFNIAIIDVYGQAIAKRHYQYDFLNQDSYFQIVTTKIKECIKSLDLPDSKILGVSIAIQGLVTSDGKEVSYGKILNCTGLHVTALQQYLPYPCSFIHDATAGAIAELWFTKSTTDAIYISLSRNLGGVIIIDGKVNNGKYLSSGLLEHMTLIPEGRDCYCGKKGCLEAYCGVNVLLEQYASLDEFFKDLRHGKQKAIDIWNMYLQYLAQGIHNMFMLLGNDIILGGQLSKYLCIEDVDLLKEKMHYVSAFLQEQRAIKIAKCTTESIVTGAALPLIQQFLKSI